MDLGLRGRVALVMGGSKGLGGACAQALAAEGCAVAVVARGADGIKEAVARLERTGAAKATGHQGDAAVAADRQRVVAETAKAHGRVDILVTNSGGPLAGGFSDIDEAAWDAAYEVVLKQVAHLVRLVAPGMRQRRWGRVLNIVSSSWREPIAGLVLSNAFRPAVVGLAKTLAGELGPHGITVNNLAPGRFDTDRLRHLAAVRAEKLGGTAEEWMARFAADSPLGRTGVPAELGEVAAFLASERAAFVTGVTVPVDGGLLRSI